MFIITYKKYENILFKNNNRPIIYTCDKCYKINYEPSCLIIAKTLFFKTI
jgi:hypothetical protein